MPYKDDPKWGFFLKTNYEDLTPQHNIPTDNTGKYTKLQLEDPEVATLEQLSKSARTEDRQRRHLDLIKAIGTAGVSSDETDSNILLWSLISEKILVIVNEGLGMNTDIGSTRLRRIQTLLHHRDFQSIAMIQSDGQDGRGT
ncbi:hypothetical protein BDQ17DRAFT_1334199 [Cyathus striatus]|nr:hypothetical protein BDQ17DRAFT_1334199 [Cyathus striatus]